MANELGSRHSHDVYDGRYADFRLDDGLNQHGFGLHHPRPQPRDQVNIVKYG